jgi:hypothetical protein
MFTTDIYSNHNDAIIGILAAPKNATNEDSAIPI